MVDFVLLGGDWAFLSGLVAGVGKKDWDGVNGDECDGGHGGLVSLSRLVNRYHPFVIPQNREKRKFNLSSNPGNDSWVVPVSLNEMAKAKRAPKKSVVRRDLYQEITDRIIEALESGQAAPWQRPWEVSPYGSTPCNGVTKRPYRGINIWLTLMTSWKRGYSRPMWLTFKQAHEVAAKAMRKAGRPVEEKTVKRGKFTKTLFVFGEGDPEAGKSVGGIRAGQNKENDAGATTVIFWKPSKFTKTDANGDEQEHGYMIMRAYQVFNVDQCDEHVREYLCPVEVEAPEFSPIEECERICEGYEIETRHGGDRAYYDVIGDRIQLPEREQFHSPEHYYTTRFHEMGHSTGHGSRLGRPGIAKFDYRGSHQYAEEELVAEFTACFLAGEAGIVRTVENQAAQYLRIWAAKLKEDPKMVVHAAQRAQKAADLVLGRKAPGATETADKAA